LADSEVTQAGNAPEWFALVLRLFSPDLSQGARASFWPGAGDGKFASFGGLMAAPRLVPA